MANAADDDKPVVSRAHARLLQQIDDEYRVTATFTGRAKMSAAVRDALARVPRHRFVEPGDECVAYLNQPLAIGHG